MVEYILKLKYWRATPRRRKTQGKAGGDSEKERNYKHWQVEVVNFRNRIFRLLDRSPSLKNYMQNIYPKIFKDAISAKQIEFTIPKDNFIQLKQILEKDYFA